MKKNILTDLKKFKELAHKDELNNECVRKTYTPEIKFHEGKKGIADFIISTNAVDRDGDTVDVNGWDLTNYLKNPVVLWAHDSNQLPVAKALDVSVRDGALIATTEFTPAEVYPFGDMVYRMIQNGFLNATSVGFLPKEFTFAGKDDEERKFGMDFKKTELLEYSIVPIPSNPEALIQAKGMGIDTSPLCEWAEKILDNEEIVDYNLSLTKSQIKKIAKLAKTEEVLIFDTSPNLKNVETPEDKGLVEPKEEETDSKDDTVPQRSQDRVDELIEKLDLFLSKLEESDKSLKRHKTDSSVVKVNALLISELKGRLA